jgi:hypothetical protein
VRIGTSSKGMIFVATISDKRVLRSMNRLMHRSARNRYSRKLNFRFTEFSKVRMQEHAHNAPEWRYMAVCGDETARPGV